MEHIEIFDIVVVVVELTVIW